MKNMSPNVASFLVTENCNLRCTYCFEKHNTNKMTKEVARKGLEFLCDNALKDNAGFFSAMIFGGEPWLMPDIVEEILKYGLELGRKNNIKFTASIVTNATLLDENIKRIYRTYGRQTDFSTQLSVDGIKEVHDRYRVRVDGKGSFDEIEKNIPEWKKLYNQDLNMPGHLNIHGCSNSSTLKYLFENYRFFREDWGLERIWFMPIHSEEWEESDVELYESELNKIADYVLDITRRTGDMREVDFYAPIDRCTRPDMFPNAPCGAGKNFATITSKGDIHPCHHMYFNDPDKLTKIGDIWEGIDEEERRIYNEYGNEDLSCAKLDPECDAYACYRCIAENLEQNGSILSVVDCQGIRCKMSKVERKIQLRVRKELEDMGLLRKRDSNHNYQEGNNPDNPDCLCDARGGEVVQTQEQQHNKCQNGDHECKCGEKEQSSSGDETIALALKMALEKLERLETGQEYIIKNLLK